MIVAAALVVAACGDDDSSPEDAFCAAGEQLRADVAAISEIDVVADGTNAVREQFETVRDDIDVLRAAGSDVASDEIDALDSAVDDLGDALQGLGDSPTPSSARAAGAAISGVVSAAGSVQDALRSACE